MKTRTIKQFMIVVALIGILPVRSVAATATLSVEDFTIKQGETKEMLIDVNNANMQVTMVEFYMQLPSGLEIVTENGELAVDIAGRTTWKKHSLEVGLTDGAVHFFLYSGSNTVLTGTSGAVISVKLTASLSFTGGNIVFERQLITSPDETECKPDNYIYKVETAVEPEEEIITFADTNVKAICVTNWDTNGDGELSKTEAAAVTDLGALFKNNKVISSFEELHYFTGLTSIGDDAFKYCYGLTNVDIPNSVISIGNYAFYGSNLTSINIPNSVTSIGSYTFGYCSNLTSINIPNSVTSIGSYAIGFCSDLTSIKIPNSVTTISDNVFFGCSRLTNINIPNSVISIGNGAFRGCSNVTNITIPNSVTSIGDYAFDGCISLTSINIPSSVTSIGFNAFGFGAFSSSSSLTNIAVDANNTVYDSRNDCNAIIKTSTNELIKGCTNTIIPSNVTKIGNSAFSGCSGLTSINIPISVTSIGDDAFENCSSLTSIIIPSSVTNIGGGAFSFCNGLISINIPSSVTSIGGDVFNRCSALTSINIPNSVTSIGESAFLYCTGLTSITIPSSVTSIGESSFLYCNGLTSITVDANNTVYDSRNDCNAIIKTSTNELINGCVNTIIPNSVTTIGKYAFCRCEGLISITIPNSVTTIGNYAFDGCSSLTNITIPSSVISIGKDAFSYCSSLTSTTIPSSVTSIGERAFDDCNNLTSVKAEMTIPVTITDDVFSNRANAILYVTKGCKAAYEAADYWKEFKEIVEIDKDNESSEIEVTDISAIDNVIYIEPMEARTGTQATISLKMKNTAPIRAFQFDLYLPEGVTAVKSAKGRIQGFLSAGRLPDEDEHTLSFSEQPDGAIRFLCGSEYDETFTGNDGEIATLLVNIADNIADGDYPIQLKGMKLTETDISKYYETALVQSKLTISTYVIGDINSDGVVDVSDYTGVANHIHNNTPAGFNAKAADVDESGSIDVSDYTGIANIIHTGSIYGNNSNARMMVRGPRKVNTDLSSKDNVIYVKPLAALAGSQATISVKMKNTAEIRSFQFDLQLPDGVTVVKSAKGKIQGSLSAGRLPEEDEHTLSFSEHEGNVIRFLCGSLSDETFTGNDGEIATLLVDVAANVEAEDHPVYLRNMKLSESDIRKFYQTEELGTTLAVAPEGSARGDANGDKSVSVTDIAVVVNEILQITNTGGFMMYGADANGDGDITVTDIGVIVDKILGTKTSANSRKMEQEVEPQ